MTVRRMLLTCSALLLTIPFSGNAQSAATDAISGTWTGDAAPRGATSRQPIRIELKLEGGAISGTVTGPAQPGSIRNGSFDPGTGELHFEVHVDGADGNPFVFRGMVVTGVALGHVTGDGVTGDFRITKQADAHAADAGSALAALRHGFGQVSDWVNRATDVQWSDAIEKASTDKTTVMRELAHALGSCTPAYENAANTNPLMENIAHTNLHYGNMVTYLRLLGLAPPSS